VDTPFWLEVDRGTTRGARLWEKLRRYYRAGGGAPGLRGRAERILIVVPRDDEARLQQLRRRLRDLDGRYHMQLDVLLTRLDLIEDAPGRLDPSRKAWRTPYRSEFGEAFHRWGETSR
jgi:hypothetical protein